MKIGRIICAVVLVLLCCCGWFTQLSSISGFKRQYTEELQAARSLEERGLHQRAIQSYEAVLAVREDIGVRQEMLEVYAIAYEDGTVTRSAYKKALESACELYPKDADLWTKLVEHLFNVNNYRDAYKALGRAERAGASSEKLSALRLKICYDYTESGRLFTKFLSTPNGYTTVYDGNLWGVLAPDGDREYDCDYLYISPYSDSRTALFCTEDSQYLIDANKVIQAILTEDLTEARAYGDNMIPVFQNGQWNYLNCEDNQYLANGYDDASSFQEGVAAVKQGSTWSLIDVTGNQTLDRTFTNIKLYDNGDYSWNNRFVASEGAAWGLYQTDGKLLSSDISALNMDVYMGDYVAFQDTSGLWGFIDQKGKLTIEPHYKQARSFSGGLAAVFDGKYWGFINQEDELVIENQFLDVGYFTSKGVCLVSILDEQFYMITLRFPGG